MAKKFTVAILMGGKSPEHEISLMSGREVVKNLNPKKYSILPIIISRDGKKFKVKNKNLEFGIWNLNFFKKIDVVFIALHGLNGEDGTIQGFLDLAQVSYTGSKVLASALAMDKSYSRKLFTQAGLSVPRSIVVRKGKTAPQLSFDFPVFVKPNNQGSSIGVSKVKYKEELKNALKKAHKYSDLAIVEEDIDGIEVTAAIMGSDKLIALPLVEIVPKKGFFDYEAKYNESLCDEIVPARISKSLTKKTQNAAILAYQTLGCQGFGRVDMIIKDNNIYVLEVNTIPGLTSISLLPKAAKAAGINYPNLLDRIISYSTP